MTSQAERRDAYFIQRQSFPHPSLTRRTSVTVTVKLPYSYLVLYPMQDPNPPADSTPTRRTPGPALTRLVDDQGIKLVDDQGIKLVDDQSRLSYIIRQGSVCSVTLRLLSFGSLLSLLFSSLSFSFLLFSSLLFSFGI